MTLPAAEFIRRFLLHVLPNGFVKVRHFGFLANRHRGDNVQLCRKLLAARSSGAPDFDSRHDSHLKEQEADTVDRCPRSKTGSMRMIEIVMPRADAAAWPGVTSPRILQMDTS
jgi:hypothetical protein